MTVMLAALTASIGAVACGGGDGASAAPAPAEKLAPRGVRVNVAVSGRGVVTSAPLGIHCGNDGDQRGCDLTFPEPVDGDLTQIDLSATATADWFFEGWHLVRATGTIPYDDVPGFDAKAAQISLDGHALRADDGSERLPQYRLEAIFSPTIARTPPPSAEARAAEGE